MQAAQNINPLNPLSAVFESLTYTYDANGNKTSMSRPVVNLPLPNSVANTSFNQANQMQTFNDKTITYDDNGNMTSVNNSCGVTNYAWDARNRLVGMSGFNTDCSPLSASFIYDAWGRRVEKTINSQTIQYLYDGMDIVQEIEGGTVAANDIRGLNIDQTLARIKSDGTVRYYQTDALGSVIALTDGAGASMTQYAYDPFGNVSAAGDASDNPFQYTGRDNDDTGLYYYRARYYSPSMHRFISEDPIGLRGGINKFVFVGNNPLSFIDPLGLEATVIASPLPTGGFSFTATGSGLNGSINGTFNIGTINFNQIQPGTYSVIPRPTLPNTLINWLFNRNQNAGRPTISNTSDWNTIRYPDGSITQGAQIHPGRNGTNGGVSRACLVTDQSTYDALINLFQANYNNGGVTLIVEPDR